MASLIYGPVTDASGATHPRIDLNSDMGEGFGPYRMGPDDKLLEHVSSASIACGFHAGDPQIMDETVRLAVAAGVRVGAHVSYPDLRGFGRRHMVLSADELVTDVLYQIGALDAFCRRYGTSVAYVKAHGALYNDLAFDEVLAGAFATAVADYGAGLPALVLSGSPAADVLRARGVPIALEAFADRAYRADGRLVARSRTGAVITDCDAVTRRAERIALGLAVEDIDGSPIVVAADSICIHGDTPGAVDLARSVRLALTGAGADVVAFA
jgi:UPF0271 protein